VPVEFLSDEQAAAYGHFLGEPTREQLERFFWLNDADLARIGRRPRSAMRYIRPGAEAVAEVTELLDLGQGHR
jgi:hypothetical protein